MALTLLLIVAQPAAAQISIKGPKGDMRPGPVCAWFARQAGHKVIGYYNKVWQVRDRIMAGVKLESGRRVNCIMDLGLDRFTLVHLTDPFVPGSEAFEIVPIE